MRPHDNPTRLTSEERFRELARLLAAGLLRLRLPADSGLHPGPEKPLESGPNGLEVGGETRLSVHTG